MALSPFVRSVVFSVTASLFLIVLNGCQQVSEVDSAVVSNKGIKGESFLPDNTLMVFTFGTGDESQHENLQQLIQYFPQQDWENLLQEAVIGINKDLENYNMTIENDLLPIFGNNYKGVVGFVGELNPEKNPNMLMAFPLADVSKMDQLFNSITATGDYERQSFNGVAIYSQVRDEFFAARYEDVLLLSNKLDVLRLAIESGTRKEGTLLFSADYQKALKKAKDSIGFFYLDLGKFFVFMEKSSEKDIEAQKAMKMLDEQMGLMKGLRSEIFALYAEPEGLRLKMYVIGDENILKSSEFNFVNTPTHEAYLYKNLPAEGLILFGESYNLKQSLELNMKVYKNMEGMEQIGNNIRAFFALQGLDVEKDILSFMDKGFAFGVAGSPASLVPGIFFVFDASSNPQGAKKVVEKLHMLITSGVAELTKQPEFADFITDEQMTGDGNFGYLAKLHLDRLPQNQLGQMPPEFRNSKIEFSYGLMKDNRFMLALYPDFIQKLATTPLSDDAEFTMAKGFLDNGFDQGLSYISTQNFFSYLDQFVKLLANDRVPTPTAANEYEKIKQYFSPVKSFIFAATKPSIADFEMQGFIHIGK